MRFLRFLRRATSRVSLLKTQPVYGEPYNFGIWFEFSEKKPMAKTQFCGENPTRYAA